MYNCIRIHYMLEYGLISGLSHQLKYTSHFTGLISADGHVDGFEGGQLLWCSTSEMREMREKRRLGRNPGGTMG